MEKGKHIHFVNWRKHKAESALKVVDDVIDSIVDDYIFEQVIDFCRSTSPFGYPAAPLLSEFAHNYPIMPLPPFVYPPLNQSKTDIAGLLCPVCKTEIEASYLWNHMLRCMKSLNAEKSQEIVRESLK